MSSNLRKCALAFGFLVAGVAHAVPTTVQFTGRLTEGGQPVSGAHELQLLLFNDPQSNLERWTETHSVVIGADGLVYLTLGLITPLDEEILDGGAVYLEIRVDGTALTPRLSVGSVPYAIRANIAERAEAVGALSANDLITAVEAG